MATKYIERERIEKFFDGIYDCADLTFEPNDHCCAADDCAHCKWRETMNAIQKRILSIPGTDVLPVVRAEFVRCGDGKGVPYMCSHCGRTTPANMVEIWGVNFCPNCGANMREES